jgi:hypothetical protein
MKRSEIRADVATAMMHNAEMSEVLERFALIFGTLNLQTHAKYQP